MLCPNGTVKPFLVSLVEPVAYLKSELGLGRLNPTAVYKRLRSAEEWLRWLAEQMRSDLGMVSPSVGRRVRAVDATSISEQGSTGTDWRIHYAINLKNLQCDFFLLTDVRGGENMAAFSCVTGGHHVGRPRLRYAERSSACSRSKRGRGGTVKPRRLFPCLTKRGSVSQY